MFVFLMMSAKLDTLNLLKIKLFSNKGYFLVPTFVGPFCTPMLGRVKNLFEQEEKEDYYKPVRVGNFYSNNYIE